MNEKSLSAGNNVRRILFYLALAIVSLVGFAVFFSLLVYSGHVDDVSSAWLGGVGYTLLLFFVGIRDFRPHWRNPGFWVLLASLFTLHLVALVVVLRAYPQWRMIWFVPIVIIEGRLFGAIVHLVFDRTR